MLEGYFYSSQMVRACTSKQLTYISNTAAREDTSPNISISQGRTQIRDFGYGLCTLSLKPWHHAAGHTNFPRWKTAFAPSRPSDHRLSVRTRLWPQLLGGLRQFCIDQLLNNNKNNATITLKSLTCFPITPLCHLSRRTLKPPWEKLMEKFNKPVKSILRNQQELIAKENHFLLKTEENKSLGHDIYRLFAKRYLFHPLRH